MKSIFISILVSICILFSATVSAGMPVVDVGAATLLTKQLAELKSQAESLKKQLENLSPDSHQWGNTQNLINQLQDNIRQSNALAYSAGDLDQRFRTTYAGYKASKNYQEEYRTITNSSQQTFNNVL